MLLRKIGFMTYAASDFSVGTPKMLWSEDNPFHAVSALG